MYSDFSHLRFPLGSVGLCHAWEGASRRWRLGYTLCPHVAIVTAIKIYLGISCFQALEVEQEQKLPWNDPEKMS